MPVPLGSFHYGIRVRLTQGYLWLSQGPQAEGPWSVDRAVTDGIEFRDPLPDVISLYDQQEHC